MAFQSTADDLVPGDTNDRPDVFVRDRTTGRTSLVSVSSSGQQGSRASFDPVISADGRLVAFESLAPNLVPADTNGVADVFLRDLRTGTTTRVSVTTGGGQADGRSFAPYLSRNASRVAFTSEATNLVPNDRNGKQDVFLRDRVARTTSLVDVSTSGRQSKDGAGGGSISADGTEVAFQTGDTTLDPGRPDTDPVEEREFSIYVRDLSARTTSGGLYSRGDDLREHLLDMPFLSPDGSTVAYQVYDWPGRLGRRRGGPDWDWRTDSSGPVSGDSVFDGGIDWPTLNGNGKIIVDCLSGDRNTGARNQIDVYLAHGGKQSISASCAGLSDRPSAQISQNGRSIAVTTEDALSSTDTNAEADVYVWDRVPDTITRISGAVSRRGVRAAGLLLGSQRPRPRYSGQVDHAQYRPGCAGLQEYSSHEGNPSAAAGWWHRVDRLWFVEFSGPVPGHQDRLLREGHPA